jgi:hypothetical protein
MLDTGLLRGVGLGGRLRGWPFWWPGWESGNALKGAPVGGVLPPVLTTSQGIIRRPLPAITGTL